MNSSIPFCNKYPPVGVFFYSAMCIGILSVLSAQERFPKCVIAIASAKKNDYNMPVFIQDKVNLEQGENR